LTTFVTWPRAIAETKSITRHDARGDVESNLSAPIDAHDAMTPDRPYRRWADFDEASAAIVKL